MNSRLLDLIQAATLNSWSSEQIRDMVKSVLGEEIYDHRVSVIKDFIPLMAKACRVSEEYAWEYTKKLALNEDLAAWAVIVAAHYEQSKRQNPVSPVSPQDYTVYHDPGDEDPGFTVVHILEAPAFEPPPSKEGQ
jgi:hypothetical protein